MPATYEPIATTTLGSDTPSTAFTSIPSTYTDLVLVAFVRDTTTSTYPGFNIQFNADFSGSTAYSWTRLEGNGSTAASTRVSSTGSIQLGLITSANGSYNSGAFAVVITNIQNYSNTTTNKTTLSRSSSDGAGFGNAATNVGLWRNTAAINRIDLTGSSGLKAGSTFTLYGIKAA
jgi:hypothetical protein